MTLSVGVGLLTRRELFRQPDDGNRDAKSRTMITKRKDRIMFIPFGNSLKTIGPCKKPDDTGCVVSWNTFGRNGNAVAATARTQARYVDRFKTEIGKEIMCINPLTFDVDRPDAVASANLGALPGAPVAGPLAAVKPGLIGATCRDGALLADIPTDKDFVLNVLPGEVLHMHDVDFFYQNIRANAVLRTEAFLKVHGS